VGCRADSILTSDWTRGFYNLRLIEPVRFLLRKQSEHDGAAISLIEISLSFFFPPFLFILLSVCRRYSLTVRVHHSLYVVSDTSVRGNL
jgi:hypothetical protein